MCLYQTRRHQLKEPEADGGPFVLSNTYSYTVKVANSHLSDVELQVIPVHRKP